MAEDGAERVAAAAWFGLRLVLAAHHRRHVAAQ
jgi:hypothetical protein